MVIHHSRGKTNAQKGKDLPSCTAIVHVRESSYVTVIRGKATLAFPIDIGNGLRHTFRKRLVYGRNRIWIVHTKR